MDREEPHARAPQVPHAEPPPQEGHRVTFNIDEAVETDLPVSKTTSLSSISEQLSSKWSLEESTNQHRGVLVELYDLKLRNGIGTDGVWEETARWIKYEEDVEGVDHRWGQPHVAFLPFHALLQLRKCIAKGTILLDTTAERFTDVCNLIGHTLATEAHCALSAERIKDVLLLQHNRAYTRKQSRLSTVTSAVFEQRKGPPSRSNSAFTLKNCGGQQAPEANNVLTAGEPLLRKSSAAQKRKWSSQVLRKRSISHVVSNTLSELRRVHSRDNQLDGFKGDVALRYLPVNTESAQVFVGCVADLKKVRFVMVRLKESTFMREVVDHSLPIRFFFVILGPKLLDVSYHELGRAISTLMSNKDFNTHAYNATNRVQLIRAVDNFLDSSVVIPPGEVDSKRLLSGNEIKKALKRRSQEIMLSRQKSEPTPKNNDDVENGKTAQEERKKLRFFDGMVQDLANRYPKYWSDITDAFEFQCLTSVVFMFFASFAPAITFGGKYTDEKIGMIETLFAQCICGVIWGLFSAQPLLIMSATGPVLIFEASLYTFCEALNLDFMAVRLYAGVWILLIAVVIVAVDGSRLLKYVTRFTEDIFATLISAIFIAESLEFVYHNPVEDFNYYEHIHVNCTPELAPSNVKRSSDYKVELMNNSNCSTAEPNTALLTAIIVFSTFVLAFSLKKLRESFYLGRPLRRAIGDFGVLLSIAIVTSLVEFFLPDAYLQRLDMPDHINFTNPQHRGHGLIVTQQLTRDNLHGPFVAFIAAILVFILLFVETEITELLLTRKERGCVKGSGMNWDLLLIGFCSFLCSIFGLPWMCAAAVQSLAHCSSLTVTKKGAPGARIEVDRVIEQRVTTIGVSLLIGAIAFAGSYLRLPLASLFGVFLYLGVMNMCGVQLIQRVVLFFIPQKYFPVAPYTEQVGLWRMHMYTWIQIVCLVLVYMVKHYQTTALAFPFVLMIFIMVREFVLPVVFTDKELKALDGDEEDEEWMDKDFYENAPIPV